MNTLENNFDALEQVIFEENIRIQTIDFHPDLDLMLVVLNTRIVLRLQLSQYSSLQRASLEQLKQYELIANGVGVHWPSLDEDLSLKGFLQSELRKLVA